MNYTIKKLAQLSGVTVRMLRFYDEIGLLKPAFIAQNGYRYYQEEQLLRLQQILFFRELGFELKRIRQILGQSDFDIINALQAHKKVLQENSTRMQTLVTTVDNTIKYLQGKHSMNEKELFYGFNSERQEKYEEYLIERFGDKVETYVEESKKNVALWEAADWEHIKQENTEVYMGLVSALQQGLTPEYDEVQKLIDKHYRMIKKFWVPDKASYKGLGQLYIEHPDFQEFYQAYHPNLAQFLANAMEIYADRKLR